jgi:hypothetical protein
MDWFDVSRHSGESGSVRLGFFLVCTSWGQKTLFPEGLAELKNKTVDLTARSI